MLGAAGNSGDLYYLFDRLGSVLATVGLDGEVVERYAYDPYGQQVDPNLNDPNPWRYVSGYHDVDTGMIKFGNRYYMPDLARWTQPAPEAVNPRDPMSLNTYGYANCNPTNNIDPTGRHWEYAEACFRGAIIGGITGGVGGLVSGLLTSAITLGAASPTIPAQIGIGGLTGMAVGSVGRALIEWPG